MPCFTCTKFPPVRPCTVLQNSSSEQLGSLWEEYDKIQVLIYQLRDLQSCPQGAHAIKRADNLPTFEKWLQDHGAVYCDNVSTVV